MKKKERIVCGLDVGTWKTCAVIVRVQGDGRLEVLGTGTAGSDGLVKGVIVNLEAVAASVRKAADEAELKSDFSIDWVTAGITGDHVKSDNCRGAISIKRKHLEVAAEDVDLVVLAAQSSIPIPAERDIVHVLPQEFLLDNRGSIRNPVGLTGLRLDANIHLVTCERAPMQNLFNAVNKARMRVRKVVLHSLASSEAVLSPEEKEVGTVVIDIGGGTTNLAILVKNMVRFTSVIAIGGGNFTKDLYEQLPTTPEEAERVKKEFGNLRPENIAKDEMVTVRGIGTRDTRQVSRKVLCEYLRERAAELLEFVRDNILHSGAHQRLIAGAVLTGGGSMLDGMIELASEILGMSVRSGIPQGLDGLSPELAHPNYACPMGLAILGARDLSRAKKNGVPASTHSMINRILAWARK